MYVCMAITFNSRTWINRVRLPILLIWYKVGRSVLYQIVQYDVLYQIIVLYQMVQNVICVYVRFFTLTDIRGCQSGTCSAGQETIKGIILSSKESIKAKSQNKQSKTIMYTKKLRQKA